MLNTLTTGKTLARNSSQPVALTAKLLVPDLCCFFYSSAPPNIHCTWRDPLDPKEECELFHFFLSWNRRMIRVYPAEREDSCFLEKLDLDPSSNAKREERRKKASTEYKMMIRVEKETWWLSPSCLARVVHHLHGKYPWKGLARFLSPGTEWLMSSWEHPDNSRTGVKLPTSAPCWHPMVRAVHGHMVCSLRWAERSW